VSTTDLSPEDPRAAWTPPPPPPAPAPERHRRGGILGFLISAGAILLSLGGKLKAVLLLLPKLKLFTTSASMLVSVAAYTLLWSWKFAIGFVLLLLVHEMGHVLQARREGLDASAPVFIPFLGAAILLKDLDKKDAATEARVGLAGPVIGSLGALGCVGLYELTGNEMYQALAFVGFFLNLFNLLPVLPLDGGRAMAALSPWMWIAGYVALAAMAVLYPNPIMLLILLFGGFETWRRFKGRKSTEGRTYLRVRPRTRWAVAGVYVALAIALAFGMDATFVERSLDEV
jgi:Zn-dependent protease